MNATQNTYIDTHHEVLDKAPMRQATGDHWRAAANGANLCALMDATFYPEDEGVRIPSKRTSVRLTEEQLQDVETIKELWNGLDKAMGRRRPRKWSDASVIERLLSVAIDSIWSQVGGRPEESEDRKVFVARTVAQAKKEAAKR